MLDFNIGVGDDDNGGPSDPRTEPAPHTDSFTAWDGRSVGWYVFAERDCRNLYLDPQDHDVDRMWVATFCVATQTHSG